MRLPFSAERAAALFALLDQLDRLELRSVLVGGLVPPLLLEAIDPMGFDDAHAARLTADCDLAVDLAIAEAERREQEVETMLGALTWRPEPRENQFRWEHPCGLRLDLLPVPVGIETHVGAAISFARTKLPYIRDLPRFYRGYELALHEAIAVEVDAEGLPARSLRIAGVTAFLAMKLEAWTDSDQVRKKDAHDVAWLLRFAGTEMVVDALQCSRSLRSDLVDEIVARLEASFSDPWHDGVLNYASAAFVRRNDDETEGARNAVAAAVRRLLAALAPQ